MSTDGAARPTASPARPSSPTPPPAATTTRSTRTRTSRVAVGLPGVIAHGMYTLALAARYVDEWVGEPGRSPTIGAKFTKPVVVPAEGVDVVVDRHRRRTTAPIVAHRHLRGRLGARRAARRPCVADAGARACATTPPCAWAAPRAHWVTRDHRRPSWSSAVAAADDGRRARAGAGRRQQPRRRRRGLRAAPSSRSPPAASPPTTTATTRPAGECWSPSPPARTGTPSSPRRRARLGRRRGAVGHPRLGRRHPDPERRRLRPGGRPDHRPGARLGPHAARRAHLRRAPTAASATATRASRPTPAATSSSTSPSSSPSAPSAPRWPTPSWPAPSASRPGGARRSPRCARRCSACAAARAWSSTPPTTTPGAPGRSSPTPSLPGRARCPTGAPAWPADDGLVKTSAAWLIEHAGFTKGYGAAPAPREPVDQAHPGPDQPRRGDHRRPAGAGPRGARRRALGVRRSSWSTSRCSSAASSDADSEVAERAERAEEEDARAPIIARPERRCRRCR